MSVGLFFMSASFDLEMSFGASSEFRIFGVDEVGRGPLAGPVVAAAVFIPPNLWNEAQVQEFQDSKKVKPSKRRELADWIRGNCVWALAEADAAEIDRINILQASLAAMARALDQVPANFALIDGNRAPDTPVSCQTVVKGDAKSRSIAAASILAKAHRDALMEALDREFPQYGWAQNAGYPTAQHRQALLDHGATCYHRVTFGGVKNVTNQQ